MAAKTYSTIEVARMLDITSDTLHRWIREKKVPAPAAQSLGPFRVRLWTTEDVEIARKYKAQHYWGRGGRKKRKKRST
jgi:DNA-binding transcriptional MerR regulator